MRKIWFLISMLFLFSIQIIDVEAAYCEYEYIQEECILQVQEVVPNDIAASIVGTNYKCKKSIVNNMLFQYTDYKLTPSYFYKEGKFYCPSLDINRSVNTARVSYPIFVTKDKSNNCNRGCPTVVGTYYQDYIDDPKDEYNPPNPPDPYKNVEKCEDADPINYIKACGCIPAGVADISSKVYYILRVIGPIMLIIIGGIEMAKAVSSQDESAIEKSKKKLVNKAIAAAMIFLVLTVVKFGISIVRDQNQTKGIYECVDYLLNGYEI